MKKRNSNLLQSPSECTSTSIFFNISWAYQIRTRGIHCHCTLVKQARLVLEAYSEVKNDLRRHTCLWDCREKLDNNTLKVCNYCVSRWNVRISGVTAQFFRCKSMIISSSISMRMSVRERRRSSSPWPVE
jgi:hypothetical protein